MKYSRAIAEKVLQVAAPGLVEGRETLLNEIAGALDAAHALGWRSAPELDRAQTERLFAALEREKAARVRAEGALREIAENAYARTGTCSCVPCDKHEWPMDRVREIARAALSGKDST